MSTRSIQKYFSSISLANIEAYMKQTGWSSIQRGERLDFLRINPETQETQTLYVTARADHPKFRSLVPNLIFSLSVIESREAVEVAECVFQAGANSAENKLPAPNQSASGVLNAQSPTANTESKANTESNRWIRLKNVSSAPIHIERSASKKSSLDATTAIRLPAGESVLLRPVDSILQIDFQCDLNIKSEDSAALDVYCDLPGRNASDIGLLISKATELFEALDLGPDQRAGIKSHCERFYFANGIVVMANASDVKRSCEFPHVLCTLAMLLSDVHRDLHLRADFGSVFFQLSRWLLTPWSITLSASPIASHQLSTALLCDFGGSPAQTLNWLQSNCTVLE